MITPDGVESGHTLRSATSRFDSLRGRSDEAGQLSVPEALELLALGEVIVRKASYGRQLDVRSARLVGASWSQIGAALGMTKQAAWEAHGRWIEGQAELHRASGYEGLDQGEEAAARRLAGNPSEESHP
jgi:hypothetical protein